MLANKAKFEKAFIGRSKAFHIHPFKELVYKRNQLSNLFLPYKPYISIYIYWNIKMRRLGLRFRYFKKPQKPILKGV